MQVVEERLEASWKGLRQMVTPDDDPYNVANHFSVDRDLTIVKYTHHLMALGAFREEKYLITLNYIHYHQATTSPKLVAEAFAQGYLSLAEVKIHKAVVREEIEEGEVVNMVVVSDEGNILNECAKGKVCRIRRSSYPKDDDQKLEAVERALERCGEATYKLSLNNCEHLVTEILTGSAESLQAESKVGIAVTIDSTFCRIPLGSIKVFLKELPRLILKLGSIETPMLRNAFLSLFSSGLDDGLEYLVKGVATAGKEFGQIAARSAINFASAAVIELCFLVVHTIYNIYAYKCGRRPARVVAQGFLQDIAGLVGTSLGTFFGGMLGALLLTPLGLSPVGLICGNILGGAFGGIIARIFGTKWLTNGEIEERLVAMIETKCKLFSVKGGHEHNRLLQQIYSVLSPQSVGKQMIQM